MKKILLYILSGLLLLGSACVKETVSQQGEGVVCFRIQVGKSQSRAEYNPLDNLLIRIYKEDGALIRRYTSMNDMPENLYLVAGSYKITVDAGDKSAATWTNKSYHGEKTFTVKANEAISEQVNCSPINIGAQVTFDASISSKFDKGAYVYVSASNTFSMAAIHDVPSLKFDPTANSAVGYFMLPEGVTNLSWGFFGEGSKLGQVTQTGVIEQVEQAMLYKLKFQYSKTPDGMVSVTILIEKDPEEYFDNIIFSPQPTIKGDGFLMEETVGYHNSDIRFNVSSVKKLAKVTMTANGTAIRVFDPADELFVPQAGISCNKIDDNNLTIALGSAFFANYSTGIHDLKFDLLDDDNGSGAGAVKFAIPGILDIKTSDYDLWQNTATFRAIITNPATTEVKFLYRTSGGEWRQIAASKGTNYTYAATATPGWKTGSGSNGIPTYALDKSSGIFANETYEYQLYVDEVGSEVKSFSTNIVQPIPDGDMENSGLSCFTSDNGSAPFWASGNNSFAAGLCTQGTYTGMGGAHCAKLTAAAPVGILAAGNLIGGLFAKDGLTTGVVQFGQPYTWLARPQAMKLKYYAEKIGTVNISKHAGAPLKNGDQDKARIFVAIVNWNSRHKVSSGTSAPTGVWDPETVTSTAEGQIIAYGSLYINASSTGSTMIEETIPLNFYDKTARPSGTYSLVISSATSAYGDYMVGCDSNVMYVDDFEWVF